MVEINCQQTRQRIVKFLRDEVKQAGFTKVIVPLSGGIDSSTVAFLAVKALGPENVLIARLPYQDLNHDTDAQIVIEKLQILASNVFEVEISNLLGPFVTRLNLAKQGSTLKKICLGNLMARVRMTILYDLAKKHKALVCGTENKSEYLLGYFTRFGDEASDLEPIRNLYKTQVIKLAKYLGVPEKIIKKAPSAGLWHGQTDEKELGFSYQDADPILGLHFDQKYSWEKIKEMGDDQNLVKKVRNQVERNKFKHEVPYICNL